MPGFRHSFIAVALVMLVSACSSAPSQPSTVKELRVAHFPNITHMQPLIGLEQGLFQKELGDVKITTTIFNAGPAEIEAIFAGGIDIGYIGPSPAVNGYIRSKGEALRIIAGSVTGGASLIVGAGSAISKPADLAGKKIASPQLGNTQDIALRAYLTANGLKAKENGGTVEIVPISNPDILTLFKRKELHGAWVPEPWASRLVAEAGGTVFLDERTLWPEGRFATVVVVVRKKFLDEHPDIVGRWLKAHVEVTSWVQEHPAEAKQVLSQEYQKLTMTVLPEAVLSDAIGRLETTYDPVRSSIQTNVNHAFALSFLGKVKPNITDLFDLRLLNEVLEELQRPTVS